MSVKALAYGKKPLKHRMMVVTEAEGLAGGAGAMFMRSLLSEGWLRYETVLSGSEGPKHHVIEREGPTGLLVTTTAIHLDAELETRLLSVPIDDSTEQTKAVLLALPGKPKTSLDLSVWIALQQWLESQPRDVDIPYLETVVELIPPVATRLRRDIPSFIGLERSAFRLTHSRRS